ncbi:hypothetical protein O181_093892 [Austropuccinia psidii MF-1]|uniref:Uncharacterized protein n=1 Tax=Austropuccinia psidii MF-1 TaxID=1389203 RepID=A0A9Q3J2C4_9BASI|nr:hypothetical protein [Austropuccinia psidii MF-1]
MERIYYIDGIFIDVPSIPDYWITSSLNTAFKGHASIWYTAMKKIHGRRNWPWWKSQIIQKYGNDHYAGNCPKAKKKVYSIEKVPEEKSLTEDSESDSMNYVIREQLDEDQDPREEFLVEYQVETPLEIQEIQLEEGIPQQTAKRNLHKHTQDAQKFLATPTKGMAYINVTATKMTVCIDNAQHPLIIDSGAHFSIVARYYLDYHLPNWENSSLQPKQKTSKVH